MDNLALLLCILFCPTVFTLIYLLGSVYHIYALGKSKTKIKKEKKLIPFYKKVLLLGYPESCKYHMKTAKKLCYAYWIYLLVCFLCLALFFISRCHAAIYSVFSKSVFVKLFALDIPINLYGFIMTKHDKVNGGSTWVWTDND